MPKSSSDRADAEIVELLHRRQRAVIVLEQQPLGDLELEPLRRQSRLRQRGHHLQGKAAVPELDRRQVDGDLDAVRPGRRLDAGAVQDPFAERDDHAGLLGDRDEHRGRHFSAHRMFPAHQRLAGRHPAGAQVDQRLVVQPELLRGQARRAGRVRGRGVPAPLPPCPWRRNGGRRRRCSWPHTAPCRPS